MGRPRYLKADARVGSQGYSRGICGKECSTGTHFSPSTSLFPLCTVSPTFHTRSFITDAILSWKLTKSFNNTITCTNTWVYLPPPGSIIPTFLYTFIHLLATLSNSASESVDKQHTININTPSRHTGDCGGTVVKVLCHKSEGR